MSLPSRSIKVSSAATQTLNPMISPTSLKRSPPTARQSSMPAKEQCLTLTPAFVPAEYAESEDSVASLAAWSIPAIPVTARQLDNFGGPGPAAVAAVLRQLDCRADAGSVDVLAREVARSGNAQLEDCGVMYLVNLGVVQQLKLSWDARWARLWRYPLCISSI